MGNKFSSWGKRRGETSKKRRKRREIHRGTEHDDSFLQPALTVEKAAEKDAAASPKTSEDGGAERKNEIEGRDKGASARSIPDERKVCGRASITEHPLSHGDIAMADDTLNERPPQPHSRPVHRVVELRLALKSKATKEVIIHTLQRVPPTVQALKQYIQCKHNVPICCQTILFDSVPLEDHVTLPLHYMRTGDTIDVHFLSEADIEYISKVLNTLNSIVTYLDSVVPRLCCATVIKTHLNIQDIQEIEDMSVEYFHCETTERSQANFYFFCENNGPELAFRLQKQLLTHSWEGLPDILKLLEYSAQLLCWDMTELSVMCKMPAIRHPLLSIIMLIASGTRTKQCSSCNGCDHHDLFTATEDKLLFQQTNYRVLPALTNLLETVPSCRVQIASNEALVTKFLHLMVPQNYTPQLHDETSLLLIGLVCMAYSPETHQYLVKPHIIDAVMTASSRQKKEHQNFFRYIASLFLAMLTANSAARHMIPNAQLKSISTYLAGFLNDVDITELHQFEVQRGIYWVTMQPHVRVAYTPLLPAPHTNTPQQASEISHPDELELLLYCIEFAIVSIHVMILNPENKDVLVREGLVDYVQCLPWYTPPESKARKRAVQLVVKLKDTLVRPPTLQNIARAKLAATQFGLDTILHKHVHELGTELYS